MLRFVFEWTYGQTSKGIHLVLNIAKTLPQRIKQINKLICVDLATIQFHNLRLRYYK